MLNTTNRQSFTAALTHPVTIGALALLVVNDLVFKALWPGDWTTGKLSDLAWMVFAPPLLAFLLSLATPRKPVWDKAIFLLAYVGLPLLYLAYNSYEPLHDAIIGAFMLANQGAVGSPFDPTDSLVISFAMFIAVWVWRYGGTFYSSLAEHGKFLVAGLACFAMMATSEAPPNQGITSVGIKEDGATAVARSGFLGDSNQYRYVSHDGGWTWEDTGSKAAINWGSDSVTTPRGIYRLDGLKILHSTDGNNWAESYSLEYLDTEGNTWIFQKDTQRFNDDSLSLHPLNLVYHQPSDNVIVAWGYQGVLVNTPDHLWLKIPVDPYSPTDFSFAAKSRVLLSHGGYWFTLLALSLTALALATALTPFRAAEFGLASLKALGLAIAIIVGCIFLYLGWFAFGLGSFLGSPGILVLLIFAALIGGAIALGSRPRDHWLRKLFGFALCLPSVFGCAFLLWNFGLPEDGYVPVYYVAGPPVLVFALAAILVSLYSFKYWQVVVPAFIGINLLITLSFSWWLFLGMTLVVAKTGAVTFAVLGAATLVMFFKKKEKDEAGSYQPLIPADNPDSSDRP